MRLGNERESTNFQDVTAIPKMLRMMFDTINKKDIALQDQMNDARDGYGGYENWLNQELNSLTPEEAAMMKKHGLSFNDIYVLRNLHQYPMDPSIAVYKRNAQLRRQQQGY